MSRLVFIAVALMAVALAGCQQATSSTTPSSSSSSSSTTVTGVSISAGTPSAGSVSGTTWTTAGSGSQTLQLTASLTPSGATGTITWASDDSGYNNVTVNSSGLVTAKGFATGGATQNDTTGTVKITATSSSYSATFTVNTNNFPS